MSNLGSISRGVSFAVVLFLGVAVISSGCASRRDATGESQAMSEKASIRYQFAFDSYTQNDTIAALGSALEAEKLAPNNPDVHNLLGLIYFRQGKVAEAETYFKKGIALDPKLSEIHNNLGTLYYTTKRYDEALASLMRALDNPLYLYPERIYNNLGLVQVALGRSKEAETAFARSIQLKTDFFLPYQNLGKLVMKNGDEKRAKTLLEKATALCEDCAEPRYHLGTLLMKENKASEALRLFKQGAVAEPNSYYGQLCQKLLTEEK